MKKVLGLLTLTMLSISCEKQDKNDVCIGHWVSEQTTVETIIWKDRSGNFTVSEFDRETGVKMKTVYFNTNEKGNLELKSTYEPNNYTSVVEFLPQNDTIMLGVVTGVYPETITFKKEK